MNCKKGRDGGRSLYYSCKFCARTANWKSIACSQECLDEYIAQVESNRAIKRGSVLSPERIDMDENEYFSLMKTPIAKVRDETIKDITEAGYGDTLQEAGLTATLEKINKDIQEDNSLNTCSEEDTNTTKKTRRTRRT